MTHTASTDLGAFLAHSLALEQEAAERLQELSDSLAIHNNLEAATLLEDLAQHSLEHADEVLAIASKHRLPILRTWDYEWPGMEAPETISRDRAHYLMTAMEVLEQALQVERAAASYYQKIASHSHDESIQHYANEFASEEKQHVFWIEERIKQSKAASTRSVDLDPPHMPE